MRTDLPPPLGDDVMRGSFSFGVAEPGYATVVILTRDGDRFEHSQDAVGIDRFVHRFLRVFATRRR
jgi:hypothetical protein